MQTVLEWLAKDLVGGNTIGGALLFVGAVFATFLGSRLVQAIFRRVLRKLTEASRNQLDDIILLTFEQPIYYVALLAGFWMALTTLKLPRGLDLFLGNVVTVVVLLFIAWALTNFVNAMRKTYIDPMVEESDTKLDDQLIPIIDKTIKVSIWSFTFLIVFDNIGFDIWSLLTGLGIGGLALAMAAKDTLANVFGSITIFADRPFQIDDTVTMCGHTGTVSDIGLRTCRVRTFDGTLVTVPNSLLVGGVVENLSARTARKFSGTIGLVYETTTDQLETAMLTISDILEAHPKIRDDYAVRFGGFGASTLDVNVKYWVEPPGDYIDTTHEVNLAIKRAFDDAGFDMAFPSMTVYRAGASA